MTVWRASNPKNVTVDYVLKANAEEHIKYANFDENYLIIVTFPSAYPATENYEIQVRSTLDYQLVKSQQFPVDEDCDVGYGNGLIVQVSGGNSLT